MKSAKKISEIKKETLNKRLTYMRRKTDEYLKTADSLRVSISEGNRKTDSLVPSVSLMPILNCANCNACKGLCYDIRNDCLYKNVMDSRAKNFAIYKTDPKRYFNEISVFCSTQVAFRWHIGGDIVDMDYLMGMVKVARENKNCSFLAFTKRFDLINEYLKNHRKPKNLQIIFSGWVGLNMNNPYNLPTSHPIFADGSTSASDGAKLCTGNCSHCFIKKSGCWMLKKNEQIVFSAH